jgi:uncharacterized protein (TIGR02444 family)
MAEASGSPFWRFSLQFYRLPGAADACLALQEESGVDVNLLLFLLWHASARRRLDRADVERLEAAIAPWRNATVVPLRAVRRALKSPPSLVEPGTAEAFRTRIKAIELEAERLQQEAMYASVGEALLGASVPSVVEAARANVAAYQGICPIAFSEPAVTTLLAALEQLAALQLADRGRTIL